ncbi:hypothetical protein K488DRAFT_50801, partial [Vararia minispora EC-137]
LHRQFHKAPRKSTLTTASDAPSRTSAEGYRGGTRKGLDISLGALPIGVSVDPTSHYFTSTPSPATTSAPPARLHGGILLRTIRRTSDSCIISGPSLLVDELLHASHATNIADLIRNKWLGNVSIFPGGPSDVPSRLSLSRISRRTSGEQPPKIYLSPRVGLDLSNPSTKLDRSDLRVKFVSSPYRAFILPHLLTANGRGHTFLGVLWDMERESANDDMLVGRLSSKLALKPNTVITYLDAYRKALKTEDLKKFVGSAGKGAGSSPTAVLRMTGAVRKFLGETDSESVL